MADYYVREEDGVGHYVLEDATGDLILEAGVSGTLVSQEPVEVLVYPITPARLTHEPVEVLVLPIPPARLSQEPVEVLIQPPAPSRVTQAPVEILQRSLHETVSVVFWE